MPVISQEEVLIPADEAQRGEVTLPRGTQLLGEGMKAQIQVCPPVHSTLWQKLGGRKEAEAQE